MSDWTKSRLEQMIADGVEDNLARDYKRADSLAKTDGRRVEITKDVSAFANSSGGILIYGVAESTEDGKRHLPERLDPVRRTEISKEWLDQVIQSIQPHIEEVVIHPVAISDENNTACYVVEIPQSYTAHMAQDHRCHKRHNFTTAQMEDYEVRDVMNRRTRPKLAASICAFRGQKGKGWILVRLKNISATIAKNYSVDLEILIDLGGHITVEPPVILDHYDEKYYYSFRLGQNALRTPLFSDSSVQLRRDFSTNVTVKGFDGTVRKSADKARVVIYADEMAAMRATFVGGEMLKGWVELDS